MITFGELQIGVLKDSAAFRDAVNLAANITSESHNDHMSLTNIERLRKLLPGMKSPAPSLVVFLEGIQQCFLVYIQNN